MSKKQILVFAAVVAVALILITLLVLKIGESKTIEQVKGQHESGLMGIDGVVGVGIGKCKSNEGNFCIKVYLINDSLELKKQIPEQIDGFKVDTEVTGPIEASPK